MLRIKCNNVKNFLLKSFVQIKQKKKHKNSERGKDRSFKV